VRVRQGLSALDDRALNSWLGALVAPGPWLLYRLGQHEAGSPVPGRGGTARLYARGRAEGRPVRHARVLVPVALLALLLPLVAVVVLVLLLA